MLLRYGITDFNLAAYQEAPNLLRFILAKTENEFAIKDAMQVFSYTSLLLLIVINH
jgi:hypothetical protein